MNYWDRLAAARERLEGGDLRGAETDWLEARRLRERSPGRVFWSETVGNVGRRVWGKLRGADRAAEPGRWEAEEADFGGRFRERARSLLERARMIEAAPATVRPAERLGLAAAAAYLTTTSRLSGLDRVDPAPFLDGALAAANDEGELPPDGLLDVAAPLPADVRLRLVGRVVTLLCERLPSADRERARALAADADSLLGPEHFRGAAQEAQRLWFAAQLAEGPLDDPTRAADLFAAFWSAEGTPAERRDPARLRAAALLGNLERFVLPIPRYSEALALLEAAPAVDPDLERRRRAAIGVLQARATAGRDDVWGSCAVSDDGRGVVVLWRSARPVDVMGWRDAAGAGALTKRLGAASARILGDGDSGISLLTWSLREMVEALLEPWLPSVGADAACIETLAQARSESPVPHPLLIAGGRTRRAWPVDEALRRGRAWLGVVERTAEADSSLRAGIRELARHGDRAAAFVQGFLPPELVPCEGWDATALAERPAPQLSEAGRATQRSDPELAEAASALVATSEPAATLAAWGADRPAWRLVLDGPRRLGAMASALVARPGVWTLVPPDGAVHDRHAALARLAEMAGEETGALALFHWCRIAQTHNGDLADHRLLRPRPPGACPLHDRYDGLLARLPRRSVESGAEGWAGEYAVRARRSSAVVGAASDLPAAATARNALWGLDASQPPDWVFADAAALHWRWSRTGDPAAHHRELAREGAGQLALVDAAPAFADDLLALLADWLAPYGETFVRADDGDPAAGLVLAVAGPAPDSRVLMADAASFHARRLGEIAAAGATHLLPPPDGPLGDLLTALARGEVAGADGLPIAVEPPEFFWTDGDVPRRLAGATLYVPRLASLDPTPGGGDVSDDAWRRRDARAAALARTRRALCALEIAALRSRGPAVVEVGDTRWWRGFPLPDEAEATDFVASAAAAERAAREAGAGVRDASERGGTADADRHGGERALVDWLRVQGWLDAEGRGLPHGFLDRPRPVLPAGWADATRRLTLADPDPAWCFAATRVAAAREAGDPHAWLLVVSASPPPEAAVLRDAFLSPLPSRVGPGQTAWHAVAWLRPEELDAPELTSALAARPPTEIWAGDLRDWLPSAVDDGGACAPTLRALLHDLDAPLTLHADDLPGSWRRYLADLVAAAGGVVEDGETSPGADLDLPPAAVGRIQDPVWPCPACGAVGKRRRWDQCCPACGTDAERWTSPEDRKGLLQDLWEAKLHALRERADLRRGPPLCIWTVPEHRRVLVTLLDGLEVPWQFQRSRQLASAPPPGEWLVCIHGETLLPPAECRHVLLDPPEDPRELQLFRRRAGGDVVLWFHELELDRQTGALAGDTPTRDPAAFARLIADAAAPPGGDEAGAWTGPLPPRVLEILTGRPAPDVRRALGVAAWTAAAAGGRVELERSEGGRRLASAVALVEAEYRLERLRALLDSELPELLSATVDGGVALVDPRRIWPDLDPIERAWLDRLLLGASPLTGDAPGSGLLYAPAGGILHSPLRRCGAMGSPEALAARLAERVDRCLAAARDLARERRDGASPAAMDPDVADAGLLLGLWRREGRTAPGEVALEDFAAAAAAAPSPEAAPHLLAALAAEEIAWRGRLLEARRTGFLADVVPRAPRERDAREAAPGPSAAWPGPGGPPLVLRGLAGSGRMAAAARLVVDALDAGVDPRRALVVAPTTAVAARFHLAWRGLADGLPALDLRAGPEAEAAWTVPGGDDPLAGDVAGELLVLLEAQDLPPALRFRLAQRYRSGRQLWTLDPVLDQEAPEHLYLDVPPPSQVIELRDQLSQSRHVWSEMQDLAARVLPARPRGRARRRERGEVGAHLATNRDDAVALLTEMRERRGSRLWNLVAPVRDDLEPLGRSAALAGWLPVLRFELDALLLPGPLEILAVAGDVAASGEDEETSARAAAFLPEAARAAYAIWLAESAPDAAATWRDLFAAVRRSGWAATLLERASDRARLSDLGDRLGDAPIAATLARPLFEAWRVETAALAGTSPPAGGSPLLLLTTPDDGIGGPSADLACLCIGNELPRRLYRATSRAGDHLLVLYKDRSPLASE